MFNINLATIFPPFGHIFSYHNTLWKTAARRLKAPLPTGVHRRIVQGFGELRVDGSGAHQRCQQQGMALDLCPVKKMPLACQQLLKSVDDFVAGWKVSESIPDFCWTYISCKCCHVAANIQRCVFCLPFQSMGNFGSLQNVKLSHMLQ